MFVVLIYMITNNKPYLRDEAEYDQWLKSGCCRFEASLEFSNHVCMRAAVAILGNC